jgi:glutaredoxin-like YruB-family protein
MVEASVTIYSSPDCPYCSQAKQYLSERGIKFAEHDVSNDRGRATEMLQMNPAGSVPTLVINGRVVVGFNRRLIDDALARPPPPKREAFLQNLFFDPFEK